MGSARLELDADIVALLEAQDRPIHEAARELIVLELYREGQLSGGRAAEILHLSREDFVRVAADEDTLIQVRGVGRERAAQIRELVRGGPFVACP